MIDINTGYKILFHFLNVDNSIIDESEIHDYVGDIFNHFKYDEKVKENLANMKKYL